MSANELRECGRELWWVNSGLVRGGCTGGVVCKGWVEEQKPLQLQIHHPVHVTLTLLRVFVCARARVCGKGTLRDSWCVVRVCACG